MKKLAILLTAICSVGVSAPEIKAGTFIAGYDKELQVVVTKNIQVWLNKTGVSEIRIEGEDTLSATFEDGKISAYVANPKKYFFYTLDLNPKKQIYDNRERIVSGHGNGGGTDLVYTTVYCQEGATALLTAHAGNGTSKTFCVTLK